MAPSKVTVEQLEDLVRQGEATCLEFKIFRREYEWKGELYHVRRGEQTTGDSRWVIETEPRPIHTPGPPSALAQIVAIVSDARVGAAGNADAGAQAFGRILTVLESEGLL